MIIDIFVDRERDLTVMEKNWGSPPPCSKQPDQVRRRLTTKQPPTATCPPLTQLSRGRPPVLLAEEHPPGEWHFNNHRVVGLPASSASNHTHLLCLHCRRSAAITDNNYNGALRIIHKQHPLGCTPSQQRIKIDTSLIPLLPTTHLMEIEDNGHAKLQCRICDSEAVQHLALSAIELSPSA